MKHTVWSATRGRTIFQRKALALAIGSSVALGFSGVAWSQATTGTIYGKVPSATGETIQITGGAGFNRTISVGPSGQYSITLPVGTYTVSLLQDGKVVQSKNNITPAAAGAVEVDFSGAGATNAQTLATVNVTANAIPAIDVTTTNQVTTITAKQLQLLPINRSVENIALLAPGVTAGAAELGNGPLNAPLLVFGGASVAENAYYIDGMNVTDALTGQGGIGLPYNSIEQVQTITTGYDARYGRSVGGVINQIGKSGSNQWHFGARAMWQPASLRDDYVNSYYNNPLYATNPPDSVNPAQVAGQLYQYRKGDNRSETIYDAYVSGPIVPDKLFFFLSAEKDQVRGHDIGSIGSPYNTSYIDNYPKLYAKLNWNINDSNVLSLTTVQSAYKDYETNYDFDYDTKQTGAFSADLPITKRVFRVGVLNYTSYITDNLTLNAMYGKTHGEYFSAQLPFPGFDPTLPAILRPDRQNPAYTPNGPVDNAWGGTSNMGDPSHRDTVANYRVSLDYKWRTHDFMVGIDNITTWDKNDGSIMTGPGYAWDYRFNTPGKPISGTNPNNPPYVGPPGPGGYSVSKYIFVTAASVRVAQRAAYVEDNWQITPNFLLNLGLRDDSFVNYNPAGEPYIRLTKPQWAPRIGFSWDVHGDSTTKVFGNAGRYYLALPAAVALRGAGASLYTNQYFTYTGIDQATGVPLGLSPIPENPVSGVSANNEYGQPLDPRTVAAQNIKAEYSDNFVLGMQQQFHFLNTQWVFGATGRYQKLGRIVDDWDDQYAICNAAIAQGYSNFAANGGCGSTAGFINGAVLINPGTTQTLLVNDPDGVSLDRVVVTNADQKFDMPPKRHYYSLDLSLTHQWDGKWFAKIDYVFSRAYGNTEGPVESDIGQGRSSVSITQQWDYWQLMNYSNGLLLNDQKHQLKIYGAYALTPEWTVGANLFIASGHPKTCLGYFGPDQTDPISYGSSYHWCGGKPAPRGTTGFTPWTHQLNLNVDYRPDWAQKKLDFNLAIFNVFNEQKALQYIAGYGSTGAYSATYDRPYQFETPRYARFSISYDW
ncbi:MAG TPA: TonB-dependent receptor plug domain-containing protein [Rhodanobacteraceae bacterium]|nr:TonB-dependent receptor plug domain-containing protein [Rhodanobacteraceae bacterium]